MKSLHDVVLEHDEIADLDPAERRLALRSLFATVEGECYEAATVGEIADRIDGFGPLTRAMADERVTDILVNGPGDIYIEREGRLSRLGERFADDGDLLAFIERSLGEAGVRADASRPIADARLKDGSRLHVMLPPIAPDGPLISIRRFPSSPLSLNDLVARNMLCSDDATELTAAVRNRVTIAISGGTGSGKTTLLNALLGEVDPTERVVLVEETPELRPACPHWVSLLTRDPNIEGRGAIDLGALIRASLRMRPDRIIIGEVRGAESLAALGAMSVGHEGSMVTVHARSADQVLDRMVSLALLAESGLSESSLRGQVEAAFGLVIHLEKSPRGTRRVKETKRS